MPIFVQVPCLQHAQLCSVTGIYITWSDVSMHTPKKESPEIWASLKSKKTLLMMCKSWFFSIIICLSFHQVGKRHVPGPKVSSFSEVWSISMKRISELVVWANPTSFSPCFTLKNERKEKRGIPAWQKKSHSTWSPIQQYYKQLKAVQWQLSGN